MQPAKTKMRDYSLRLACCCSMAVILVGCLPSMLFAQNQAQQQQRPVRPPMFISEALSRDAVFWAWKNNSDVAQCGLCHYQAGNDFASRQSELSRFVELKEWIEKDKHAIARQRVEPVAADQQTAWLERFRARVAADSQKIVIPDFWLGASNDLSARICRQLGHDFSKDPDGDNQWFRENCLTCHGGYDVFSAKAGKGQGKTNIANNSFIADESNHPGISCNYCHQVAPENTQWIEQHAGLSSPEKWRSLTPAEKAALGMRDLTPIREQAQLCLQCHVGDMSKNMFVTHDMYAAGHPPLPAVELKTLIEEMPRHWQSPQDLLSVDFKKNPTARSHFKANYGLDADASELKKLPWDAQAIAVGSLVAEQKWLELMVQADSKKHWGDYALYDCSACHHELNNDSRRQKIRSPGSPGRPRTIEWPHPGGLAVTSSLGNQGFKAAMDQLQAAMKKRPFGDRAAVVQASQALTKQISQSLDQLALDRMPADYNSRLLLAVCETSPESLLDYQTARWVNWSVRGLLKAQNDKDKKLTNAAEKIAVLGEAMGPGSEVTRRLPATQKEIIYPDFVQRELQLQQAYNSEVFTAQLQAIRDALKK